MPFPRALPNQHKVEDEFKLTALWLNRVLYVGILTYTVGSLFVIFFYGPQMAEKQLLDWGHMPRLTLCLDQSASTFVQSAAFVSQGFGRDQTENALSGDCARNDIAGFSDLSRWVQGTTVNSSQGRCHQLDLTQLYPFANDTTVNNLAIGGIADYRGGLFPKFIAVGTEEPSRGVAGVLASPLLYLYPQRFLLDEFGNPRRIESPSYRLSKGQVPVHPLPVLFDSRQTEEFSVQDMGVWKSCVPMRWQKGLKAGQIVFGFGLFVTSPTVKSVYSVGVLAQLLSLIGSIGGWCGISFLIWKCVFVRPPDAVWPTDQEKRTLHPRLKGLHQAAKDLFSPAEARELEEPFVMH